jgi:hypothetical protein
MPGGHGAGGRPAIVVTSINAPGEAMQALAAGASAHGQDLIVVGDTKSPRVYDLPACRFLSLDEQIDTGFATARMCPTRHYARKNIGYLLAIRQRAPFIIETDDDNWPRAEFFGPRRETLDCATLSVSGWVNVYRYFTDAVIWPRGLPLDAIHAELPAVVTAPAVACPIQQGLADGNPDVDAIFRLVLPLPMTFGRKPPIALRRGAWCPFNSQNTTWWPAAYPLLYLPAHCSFRMTDIWRSFVAQRICWENDWSISFHAATVVQDRNEHDLMRDFSDEIPGYLNNRAITDGLASLDLRAGRAHLPENLRRCYGLLVRMNVVGEGELPLLDAWLSDLADLEKAIPADRVRADSV